MQRVGQEEKVKLWLSQFDQGPDDLARAEKLLNSVNYCPLNEFKDSLVKLTRRVLPLKQPSALFIERELQPTKAKLPPPCISKGKPSVSDRKKNTSELTERQFKRLNQSNTKLRISAVRR